MSKFDSLFLAALTAVGCKKKWEVRIDETPLPFVRLLHLLKICMWSLAILCGKAPLIFLAVPVDPLR